MTLEVASVIGPRFDFQWLAHTHPARPSHQELFEQLKLLEMHDLLYQEMTLTGLVGTFRHPIVQEAAYGTLLETQRTDLHRAAGEALEQLQPTAAHRLAFHYRQGGMRDKALKYLEQAARQAQKDYANETALNCYTQALALEERWGWRKEQVGLLHILGQRAEEHGALQALGRLPDAPVGEVAYLWGQYYEALGDYGQARAHIERALAVSREHGQRLAEARCLDRLGFIAWRQGHYDQATVWYCQALSLLQVKAMTGAEEACVLTQAINGLATIHRGQGAFEKAITYYQQALKFDREVGDRLGEARTLNNLGTVAYYQQQLDAARDYYQQALTLRRAIGDREGEGECLGNLALIVRAQGDYTQARAYLAETLVIQQATGNRWNEANVLNELGILYRELGDFAAAQMHFQRGLYLAQEIGDVAGEAYLRLNFGLTLNESG